MAIEYWWTAGVFDSSLSAQQAQKAGLGRMSEINVPSVQ